MAPPVLLSSNSRALTAYLLEFVQDTAFVPMLYQELFLLACGMKDFHFLRSLDQSAFAEVISTCF